MKTGTRKYLLFLLLSAAILGGCKKDDCGVCLKSAGPITNETREIGAFSGIRLSDRIDLVITQDSVNSIVVTAGENLLGGVITEVEDDILNIRDENSCNWLRSYKHTITVHLGIKDLKGIYYEGAGNITCTNVITTDTLTLNLWDGSGKITLETDCNEVKVHLHTGCGDAAISGKAHNAYFYSRGNGQIICNDLDVPDVYIDTRGTGDISVRASQHIFARIGYDGNVYYWGDPPNVESELTGKGQLIRME